jgi:hypothetical protein
VSNQAEYTDRREENREQLEEMREQLEAVAESDLPFADYAQKALDRLDRPNRGAT